MAKSQLLTVYLPNSIGQVTPDMLQGITYGTYILFGIITYLGAAFVYFFVPETKRLTLEEMVSEYSIRALR